MVTIRVKRSVETHMSKDDIVRRCKFIQSYSISGTFSHNFFHPARHKKNLTVLRTYCSGA